MVWFAPFQPLPHGEPQRKRWGLFVCVRYRCHGQCCQQALRFDSLERPGGDAADRDRSERGLAQRQAGLGCDRAKVAAIQDCEKANGVLCAGCPTLKGRLLAERAQRDVEITALRERVAVLEQTSAQRLVGWAAWRGGAPPRLNLDGGAALT